MRRCDVTQQRTRSLVCPVGVKSDVPLLLQRHFHPSWPRKNNGLERLGLLFGLL